MSVFVHTQTGGIKVNDPEALTLKVMLENAQQVNQPMTEKMAAKRMVTQAVMQPIVPQTLICQLIGGGVPERFPDLHFSLIEFNAYWLSSLVGSMDKCWITGIGQDADWWIGVWDDARPDDDQPGMAQLFRLNEKWPYPLMPSEYVQRQFHVSFQDDPVAVACRHITGLSTVMWGNDYPHAEGTFRGSQELLAPADGRRPRRRAQGHGRRHPRRPPGLRGPGPRPERERRTASKDASRSSPAPVAASAAPTRTCSPRVAPAWSSTTWAVRWAAWAPTRDRRTWWSPRSSPPAARPSADTNDVSTTAGAEALIASAVDRFGRIDILINNAGIMRWVEASPTLDLDDLEGHLAVHVAGSFNTTRAAWPHMVEQGYGRIVMTTSAGMFGLPNNTSYATAKGGVVGLTRSLKARGPGHGHQDQPDRPRRLDPDGGPGRRLDRRRPGGTRLDRRADVARSRGADGRLPRPRGLPGQRRDLRRRRRPVRSDLHRVDRGLPPPDVGADDRGRRPDTGLRSTTRPATTCRPTSMPGRLASCVTCRWTPIRRRPSCTSATTLVTGLN